MTPEDRFRAALDSRDAGALEAAISSGADPMLSDDSELARGRAGYTALHVAARGSVELVRTLLDAGFPVDPVDEEDRTPLAIAWRSEVFDLLLDAGADPHHVDQWGCSALFMMGSARDSYHCVRRLLELGVDPTPLHQHGERSWFRYLYDSEIDGLRAFVEAGVDLNPPQRYQRKTALHVAAERNAVEVVRLLVGAGVDLLAVTEAGKTAADLARAENHPEVLKLLADAGGDPRAQEATLPDMMLDPHNATVKALIEGVTTSAVSDATRDALRDLGPHGRALDEAIDRPGDPAALEAFYSALVGWFDGAHREVAAGFKQYVEATIGLGRIGERDDTGQFGGPFELWGVADALLRGGSFEDVTGLAIFGDRPFPGFRIGARDDVEAWVLTGHLHWGKRNGFVVILPRDAIRRAANVCAREGDYFSIGAGSGDYNPTPDFMEFLYVTIAPLDVGHLFFAQRYAPAHPGDLLLRAMFGFDEDRIAAARRRGALAPLEEALR